MGWLSDLLTIRVLSRQARLYVDQEASWRRTQFGDDAKRITLKEAGRPGLTARRRHLLKAIGSKL